jgi:hypothetical protein
MMKHSSSVNVKSILFLRACFATSQISCFVVIVMARSRRKEESLDMFPGAHFQLIVETWRDTNVEFEIRIRVLSLRGAGTNIHLQSASLLILQLLNKLPQIKSCKLQ